MSATTEYGDFDDEVDLQRRLAMTAGELSDALHALKTNREAARLKRRVAFLAGLGTRRERRELGNANIKRVLGYASEAEQARISKLLWGHTER